MPDFIGDDFDKAPVTVPPKDDRGEDLRKKLEIAYYLE